MWWILAAVAALLVAASWAAVKIFGEVGEMLDDEADLEDSDHAPRRTSSASTTHSRL